MHDTPLALVVRFLSTIRSHKGSEHNLPSFRRAGVSFALTATSTDETKTPSHRYDNKPFLFVLFLFIIMTTSRRIRPGKQTTLGGEPSTSFDPLERRDYE